MLHGATATDRHATLDGRQNIQHNEQTRNDVAYTHILFPTLLTLLLLSAAPIMGANYIRRAILSGKLFPLMLKRNCICIFDAKLLPVEWNNGSRMTV